MAQEVENAPQKLSGEVDEPEVELEEVCIDETGAVQAEGTGESGRNVAGESRRVSGESRWVETVFRHATGQGLPHRRGGGRGGAGVDADGSEPSGFNSDDEEELFAAAHPSSVTTRKQRVTTAGKRTRGRGKAKPDPEVQRLLSEMTFAFMNRDFQRAVPLALEVVRRAPRLAQPYHTLGLIYEEQLDFKKAIDFFLLAANFGPRDPAQWKRVGEMACSAGLYGHALNCFGRFLRLQPNEPEVWHLRAALLRNTGKMRQAAHSMERYCKMVPDDLGAAQLLAQLWYDCGSAERAAAALEAGRAAQPAGMQAPGALNVLHMLCELDLALGRFEAVEGLYSEALEAAGGPGAALPIDLNVRHAMARAHTGHLDEALSVFEGLLERPVGEYSDLYLDAADCCIDVHAWPTAALLLRPLAAREGAMGPAFAPWMVRLAGVEERLGNRAAAVTALRRAIEVADASAVVRPAPDPEHAAAPDGEEAQKRGGAGAGASVAEAREAARQRVEAQRVRAEAAAMLARLQGGSFPADSFGGGAAGLGGSVLLSVDAEQGRVGTAGGGSTLAAVKASAAGSISRSAVAMSAAAAHRQATAAGPAAAAAGGGGPGASSALRSPGLRMEVAGRLAAADALWMHGTFDAFIDTALPLAEELLARPLDRHRRAAGGKRKRSGVEGGGVAERGGIEPLLPAAGDEELPGNGIGGGGSNASSSSVHEDGGELQPDRAVLVRGGGGAAGGVVGGGGSTTAGAQLALRVLHVLAARGGSGLGAAERLLDAAARTPSLSADPQRRPLRLLAVAVHWRAGRYARARDEAQQLLSAAPASALLWSVLARTAALSRPVTKHMVSRHLTAAGADCPAVQAAYGHVYFASRSYTAAAGYYLQALAARPSDPMLAFFLGLALLNSAMSRATRNRHARVVRAFSFLFRYAELARSGRSGVEGLAADYNLGRAFHQLRVLGPATRLYRRVLAAPQPGCSERGAGAEGSGLPRSRVGAVVCALYPQVCERWSGGTASATGRESEKGCKGQASDTSASPWIQARAAYLRRLAAYNLALIYADSGNAVLARQLLAQFVVV